LSVRCPKCQTENPDTQHFCGDCGTQITPPDKVSPSITKTLETHITRLAIGSLYAERYEILEELGKGGMGEVYRVKDETLDEEMALKVLKPEIAADKDIIERFKNELKFARKITHRNVCRMHDLNEEEETPYITMEYVKGEDLKRFIRRKEKITEEEVIAIAKQVCEGLSEAHELGVVHRDLKPQNIMIDEKDNAKVMDFGIARSVEAPGVTQTGVMIGTPDYMSPEQAEGEEADQRSDIYALGVILYEMVTGSVPFKGDTAFSVALKHKSKLPHDPKKLNSEVSDDLNRLILICLEKERERRYQTTETLLADLRNIEEGLPLGTKIRPRRETFATALIRKKLFIPAVVVCLSIIAVAIWQLLPEKKTTNAKEKRMLAVLPFENLGSPEDEYFADGMTDEVIARMTNITNLSVIARNSTIQYKKTTKSIKEIGNELGVDFILSGTIRWQKPAEETGRVRVTPTLIKVVDSTQMWADIYDESFTEVFQVQSDIAKHVVDALDIVLLGKEELFLEKAPTENLDAYEYYLRGKDYFYRGKDNRRESTLAIELFEKAVNLDPQFALAFVSLSLAHSNFYWFHWDRSEERVAKAKQAIDEALEIDPDLPEAYLGLAHYYYHCKLDYDNALEQLFIAKDINPKNSEIMEYTGYINRRQGRFDQAVTYFKKALEIDPRSSVIANNLGQTYALMRKYTEAERYLDRAISLLPDYVWAYHWKAFLYLKRQGDTRKVRSILEELSKKVVSLNEHLIVYLWIQIEIFDGEYQKALDRLSLVSSEAFNTQFYYIPKAQLYAQIYGLMNKRKMEQEYYDSARQFLEDKIKAQPNDSRFHSALGIAYASLGFNEKSIQEAERAVALLPVSKEAYRGVYREEDLASVYVKVGEYDKAIDKIEYLLSIPANISIPLAKLDPRWAPLREHPRFQDLLERNK
jgi:serine/threonine protein kinase/tetratricopeptide (TPR) repeat protein